MIYLIGIDHLVQYNGPIPPWLLDDFKTYLDFIISDLHISIIAEEFNEEFLVDVYGADEDTAKSAAERAGIEHIYCDPDSMERYKLGIPYYADIKDSVMLRYNTKDTISLNAAEKKEFNAAVKNEVMKYWGIRENFWYERLKNRLDKKILFLCGHEHVDRFRELIENNGKQCVIIDKYWKREIFSNYEKINLR